MSRDARRETRTLNAIDQLPQSRSTPGTRYESLADWLTYQEQLHPRVIDLGLERLVHVLAQLQWRGFKCPVITVGGTNGKGSCVALLESILAAQGYRVGAFTSPHLIRYNERIRVAGREVSDDELIAAFERIEAARGDTSITFFEFNTLAALLTFAARDVDVVVLEVGLGGTLDAVNVVDADVAIVSSIGLDHCEWLGNDVESIARWKAGIFRPGRSAIFGARNMPAAIQEEAERIGARLQRLGVDFQGNPGSNSWSWRGRIELPDLPIPGLPGIVQFDNAASVLAALDALRERLPVAHESIKAGLRNVRLAGRFEVITVNTPPPQEWILDVAHNPAAAETLARNLKSRACSGRTIAVCGMFVDKDVDGVIAAVSRQIDRWVAANVSGGRALAADVLATKISLSGGQAAVVAADVVTACKQAQSMAAPQDRIVVFGSFHTVGPALEWLQHSN